MVTELRFNNAYASQREIYDERYQAGLYDRRSPVRVLAAERQALCRATSRAVASNPRAKTISLFDFGYGTGRVTNQFIESYAKQHASSGRDLRVVAYDVSSAGMMKACRTFCAKGFAPDKAMSWNPDATAGYIAGSVSKTMPRVTVTIVFVHGHEAQSPEVMRRLALEANRLQAEAVWASSGLTIGLPGHVVGRPPRGGLGGVSDA
jgi:hypothetical protein